MNFKTEDLDLSVLWLEMYKIARRINNDRFEGVLPRSENTVRLLELLDKTTPENVQNVLADRQNKKEVTA